MPLPVPSLDDRSFEDLFQEARNRIQAHTPEWTQINPGDPGVALIDLFAWLAETILYRQNLIPLRQRRAFLNLLAIPMRPATPASGVVCLDAPPVSALPPAILVQQALLTATGSPAQFTNTTELQPTWLGVVPMIKAPFQEPDPTKRESTLALLRELYGIDAPTPFVAQRALQDGALTLSNTLDQALYLALVKPQKLTDDAAALRQTLAGGITLSIGVAPPDDTTDQAVTDPPPRRLVWSLASTAADGSLRWLQLEVLLDTSNGGRKLGVVQLQLPRSAAVLTPPVVTDPMNAGLGASPPELPADVKPESLVAWLRLTSPDDPALSLAWLGVNAVGVVAQTIGRDALLGIGTGEPDQSFSLRVAPVDPTSLVIEVWPPAVGTTAAPPSTWLAVDHFGAAGRDDKVYVLDPAAGTVRFGDGMQGARVPNGAAVYARRYAYGGGQAGNLAPGSIKQLAAGGGIVVRHEWPTAGGTEGETVAAAERRIPAFLANRDRAVTAEDFRFLAENVPGANVARAEVVSGHDAWRRSGGHPVRRTGRAVGVRHPAGRTTRRRRAATDAGRAAPGVRLAAPAHADRHPGVRPRPVLRAGRGGDRRAAARPRPRGPRRCARSSRRWWRISGRWSRVGRCNRAGRSAGRSRRTNWRPRRAGCPACWRWIR